MEPACTLALSANFGDVDRWREGFAAGATASWSEAGQMLLVFQPRQGTLLNQWAADGTQPTAGGLPIIALDLRGHTGVEEVATRVDEFIDQIDWIAAYKRYQDAVHAASEPHGVAPEVIGNAQVIDVRRAGVFEKAGTVISGAHWRDPATVGAWAADLPKDRSVVVYCVFGHEVSRATALRLRASGVDARYLRGGIEAWQTSGYPIQNKQ